MKASFMHAYDPETKLQSSQWKSPGSPRPKQARRQKSKLKMMLICFFDQEGSYTPNLSHLEWRSMQTSTVMFLEGYVKMWGARGHRNGKTRTSLSTTTIPQLTGPLKFRSFWPRTTWQWSPILHTHTIWPPCDFFLFPKLKLRMKGRRFDTTEEIQE